MSKIRCKFCNKIIQSLHRHDFVTCECGSISLDGGDFYIKISFPSGFKPEDCYENVE